MPAIPSQQRAREPASWTTAHPVMEDGHSRWTNVSLPGRRKVTEGANCHLTTSSPVSLPRRLWKDISQLMAMARRTVRVSRSLFADQVPVEGGRGSRRLVPRTVHCVLVPCDVGGGPRGGLFGWTAGRLAARLLSNLPGLWNVV
ncbi:hypothetical protein C0Q70_12420 [Pomacea canaliculata]|uniref:Uncharacterized protein n=1 Tax=Pomacea canaliculata TaxID=400727 RepID=A0A2T7P1G6_POMCA|nr:hypothetical protein C0Q70_12420 [Pomacea canaliculata]